MKSNSRKLKMAANSLSVIPALVAATLIATPDTAHAVGATLNSGNERINFSGKLRMLSQRMAAAGCNLSAGINPEKNGKILTNAKVEFGKILGGLEKGNGDLKIDGAEANTEILTSIGTVRETFAPIDQAVVSLTKDPGSVTSIELINRENMALLGAAKSLVTSIVSVYSAKADDDAGLGKTINVAGRQRMLTQKMSKEACQIWSGGSAETVDALRTTMQLFEGSLIDLRDGKNGMVRPPNREIADGLADITNRWDALKPSLEKAVAGAILSKADRAALTEDLNTTLREMNKVVGLYVVAKKSSGNVDDIGATERVNFSGKLRMLSQRVAAAACNYSAGIDADNSLKILVGAQSEFQKITRGLEFGDADLRMKGEEKRRKTLKALNDINEEWSGMSLAIDNLVQGIDVDTNLAYISTHNMQLLARAKHLVSELSGQYSDPTAMLQADAMLVDVSGRQRMLTQKMSKESCQVWNGDAESAKSLAGTMQMFEVSLMALRNGMDAAGIKAAPTDDIMYGLDDIIGDWEKLKPVLEQATSNVSVDDQVREEVFANLNTMLKEMNAVVGLYTIYGKTGL